MRSKNANTLVYSNLFTKLFEREKVKLNDETEKIAMRLFYDIYFEKNLAIMYMVKRDGGWDFKNSGERGNPELAKSATPKAPKNAVKQTFVGSFILLALTSLVVEQKLGLVAALVE